MQKIHKGAATCTPKGTGLGAGRYAKKQSVVPKQRKVRSDKGVKRGPRVKPNVYPSARKVASVAYQAHSSNVHELDD